MDETQYEVVDKKVLLKTASSSDPAICSIKHYPADGKADSDYFGYSVSISGDYVVIGAYLDDIGGNSNQGSAYIFEH